MGLAFTGGPNILGRFPGANSCDFLLGLEHHLRKAGWKRESYTAAYCVGTYNRLPSDGSQVQIDNRPYQFRQTIANSQAGQVQIGETVEETLINLAAAINGAAGAGVRYSKATTLHGTSRARSVTANSIRVEYRQAGPAGNGLVAQGNEAESSWTAGAGTPAGRMWNGTFLLRGTSPQGLAVLLSLHDRGNGPKVQLISAVNPALSGLEHPVNCVEGRIFQVVAGPCQFFLCVPGLRFDVSGSAVAGGVLRVADPVRQGEVPPTGHAYEAWWSSGDAFGNPFFPASNPRICLRQKDIETNSNPWSTEAIWNQQRCEPYSAAHHKGCAEILCITATSNVDLTYFFGGVHASVRYLDGSPLYYEPFVAWGDTNADAPVLRGQLWDARIGSLPAPMDQLITDPDDRH